MLAFTKASQRQDLNPQPSDYKTDALPIVLRWREGWSLPNLLPGRTGLLNLFSRINFVSGVLWKNPANHLWVSFNVYPVRREVTTLGVETTSKLLMC